MSLYALILIADSFYIIKKKRGELFIRFIFTHTLTHTRALFFYINSSFLLYSLYLDFIVGA